jgi:hypothetical protein
MGYKPKSKLYDLEFSDYPGLEVFARGASLGKLLDLGTIQMTPQEMAQNPALRDEVFGFFVTRIAQWNMEHPEIEPMPDGRVPAECQRCGLAEGTPMPISLESLLCLDIAFVLALMTGWMVVLTRVSLPKEMSSNDGETNSLMDQHLSQLEKLASLSK